MGGETLGEGATADLNINRDIDNVDKALYSIDRQQGNIDLTVDHASGRGGRDCWRSNHCC